MTADQGTYTLVLDLATATTITFGAAGERDLPAGGYAYTGSAFGTGGFSRIDRHRELAAGERETRHWHVDYLLCHPESHVEAVVTTAGQDVECAVASTLTAEATPVDGIGASDCDCGTHLVYAPDVAALVDVIERAHGQARSGE
nr:GIY-YIG nuclease family protein [Halorhabdus sp. CBA1104]